MAIPLAHVVFLLDDSGSMGPHVSATCEAFNAYTTTLQKTKGAEIRFSLFKFGGCGLEEPAMQWNEPVQDAVTLSRGNYHPTSDTRLYNAIVSLIDRVETELKKSGPRKVVVCIQTDGQSAGHYLRAGLMVRAKQKEGWEFVFMALSSKNPYYPDRPGFDFMNVAVNELGIPKENVIIYGNGEREAVATFSAAGWNVGSFSAGRSKHAAFTEQQRKAAK